MKSASIGNSKIYQLYLQLCQRYGRPRDFWQKWCKRPKGKQDKEEVVLGAVLTQRISWFNVEKALANLKAQKALSIKGVYKIGKKNTGLLEELIKPTGFYKQKAKKLFGLCRLIIEKHAGLDNFFKQDLSSCRQELLGVWGVGPETADDILLYAGQKPIFVIDEYTRRFAKKHNLARDFSYHHLQQLFENSLPKSIKVFQDYHAMIVLQGRGTTWDLTTKL